VAATMELGGRLWRVAFAAGIAGALCLGAIAPAMGAGGAIKTRSVNVSVDPAPGAAQGVVRCPRKSSAISGGFWTPSYDPEYVAAGLDTFSSKRSGKNGWAYGGVSVADAPTSFTGYVYCGSGLSLVTRTAHAPVAADGGTGSATATCPRG